MHEYNLEMIIRSDQRYSHDQDFFFRDNEESFYIAGYWGADGCVKSQRGNRSGELSMSLGIKDADHFLKMKNVMKIENPLSNKIVKNHGRIKDSYQNELSFTSRKLCYDLLRFNIAPRKTLNYSIPDWLFDHPLLNHFLRGFIDGDGTFCMLKQGKYGTANFSIVGTEMFVRQFREILIKQCNLPIDSGCIAEQKGCWCLSYGGNLIVGKIANYIYKDATIYLQRKYQYAEMAIKHLSNYSIEKEHYEFNKAQSLFRKKSSKWFNRPEYEFTKENVIKLYSEIHNIAKVAKLVKKRLSVVSEMIFD